MDSFDIELSGGLGIDGMACFKGPSPKSQICITYLRVKSPQTQQPQKSKSSATYEEFFKPLKS